MQNEVIEDMIGRKVTNNPSRRARESYYVNQGIYRGDPRMDLDDLPLGRIATNDFAYCRVIDRMLMYERRIENSLHKTLRELERRQLIRQFHQQEAEQELPRQEPDQFQLAPSTAGGSITDLKKQSQFTLNLMGATPFVKRDYDKIPLCGVQENKAKQSQFHVNMPTDELEKSNKPVASTSG